MFTALSFGLSTAYHIFTKVVHSLAHYWRSRGLRILVYLDDGLCVASGEEDAPEASRLVRNTLYRAGFVHSP